MLTMSSSQVNCGKVTESAAGALSAQHAGLVHLICVPAMISVHTCWHAAQGTRTHADNTRARTYTLTTHCSMLAENRTVSS